MPAETVAPQDSPAGLQNRFVWAFALVVGLLLAIPAIHAMISVPPGALHLGYQYNTDDHMVYAAWMRQAMEGRFFFENRFTTDAQPGLTVHLYFLFLGQIARLTGIVAATHISRVFFGVLFVFLLARLLRAMDATNYGTKLGLILGVFGAGLGAMVWHDFGVAIVKPAASFLAPLSGGLLPIDVWQPEAFVFPALLTSSLFAVSLCLIVGVLIGVLEAKDSWKPVLPSALMFALLMNIHSYDVLIVTLVLVGFLAMTLFRRRATREWITRAVVIGLGALPSALYFVVVISKDPVFRNRAGVETLSPNLRVVLLGILLLVIPALVALWPKRDQEGSSRHKQAFGAFVLSLVALVGASTSHTTGMFMNMPGWIAAVLVGLAICVFLARDNDGWNLVVAWAVLGLVALYFPAAFQRKLGMALSVPWALLASFGVAEVLKNQERNLRNLATALVLMLTSWSSFRWLGREIHLIDLNVSNTTVHSAFLSPDMVAIIEALSKETGRKVTIALPGVAAYRVIDGTQSQEPDQFIAPFVTDLNPIVTGFAGATTYAGHWGETPDYGTRRTEVQKVYLQSTPDEERNAILSKINPDFVIAPIPSAFPEAPYADLSSLGEVTFRGSQFVLIHLKH